MTKMVATVAALQLIEQGKLDLNAPIEQYCPEFAKVQVLERVDGGKPVVRPPASKATSNTHFWVDRTTGITGAIYSQFLPFVTPEALQMYVDFETRLYASL